MKNLKLNLELHGRQNSPTLWTKWGKNLLINLGITSFIFLTAFSIAVPALAKGLLTGTVTDTDCPQVSCTKDEDCGEKCICIEGGCVPAEVTTTPTAPPSSTFNWPVQITPKEFIGGRFIPAFLGFIGLMSFVFIIWGGIVYMTSAGNEEKIKSAKRTITYAIIGLAFALISYIIVNTIIKIVK